MHPGTSRHNQELQDVLKNHREYSGQSEGHAPPGVAQDYYDTRRTPKKGLGTTRGHSEAVGKLKLNRTLIRPLGALRMAKEQSGSAMAAVNTTGVLRNTGWDSEPQVFSESSGSAKNHKEGLRNPGCYQHNQGTLPSTRDYFGSARNTHKTRWCSRHTE